VHDFLKIKNLYIIQKVIERAMIFEKKILIIINCIKNNQNFHQFLVYIISFHHFAW